MAILFQRDFAVSIGTRKIEAQLAPGEQPNPDLARNTLKVEFSIEKTSDSKPNKASVTIYNLNKESRDALSQKKLPVLIEAGYIDQRAQIFKGTLEFAKHARGDATWVSTFQTADGGDKMKKNRINDNRGPGTKLKDIIQDVAKQTGLGMGNVIKQVQKGNFRKGIEEFKKGTTLSGSAYDLFVKFSKQAGFDPSTQDEQLQLLKPGETIRIEDQVDRTSGMLGSPEIGEKGVITVRSLLRPQFSPGVGVKVVSEVLTGGEGNFKIIRVKHTGDTWGDSWFTEFEAKALA